MAFLREQDTISGKQAKAYVTLNGRQEELFYAKSLEATIEKNKADVPVLGKTNVGKKAAGWSGTGTLTIYYLSSEFRKLTREYIETGRDFYFDLLVVNDDPASNAGKQSVILKNCNLDSIIAAKFDATSDDMLEEELSFTFDDFVIEEAFRPLA